jgi:diaminopimelate epimerase
MDVPFTKMQGLGNDFVLFDGLRSPLCLTSEQVCRIADRRLGIGCDQVLLLEPSQNPEADARYRIFNADGKEVEQCGNGSRCVARYLRDERLVETDAIVVETLAGLIRMYCQSDGRVRVDMGAPRLAPEDIPMRVQELHGTYELELDGARVSVYPISMGNPHAVLCVKDITAAPVASLGPLIERHRLFPEGVNAGFMQVIDAHHIRLRVYERGVGETPACGTGACAAVVAGRLQKLLGQEVEVELPGGRLFIQWGGGESSVWMTGPATRVFAGRIAL